MPTRFNIHVVLASAVVMAACGTALEPIEVAEGCPQQPLRGPSEWADDPVDRLIDDFENPDPDIPRIGGRNGFWVFGDDETGGQFSQSSSEKCAARGLRAGHFTGKGFTSWGANWTALFRTAVDDVASPYDARGYGGISFWAALGPEAEAPYDVPVGIMTMDNAWNGNICKACMDAYGKDVQLSTTWQRFVLRFSDVAQAGFGDPLVPMRRDQLVGLIIWPRHPFDIWIDDVRFEP